MPLRPPPAAVAILTVDASNMVLMAVLVFLILRQIMPIAAGLAGGVALSSFGIGKPRDRLERPPSRVGPGCGMASGVGTTRGRAQVTPARSARSRSRPVASGDARRHDVLRRPTRIWRG